MNAPLDLSTLRFTDLTPEDLGAGPHLGVIDRPLKVWRVREALYVPASPDPRPVLGGREFIGGLYSAEGRRVDSAAMRRAGREWVFQGAPTPEAEPAARDPRPMLYLGLLVPHFGHLITESLARLWGLRALDWQGPVLWHCAHPAMLDPATPLGARVRDILALAGLSPERLVIPDGPVRLAEVIVPEAGYEERFALSRDQERALAALAPPAATAPRPTYLSRRHWPKARIAGEAELETILAERGVRIVHPETLSLAEQLAVVQGGDPLIAPVGSATHLLMLTDRRPRVIHLVRRRDLSTFLLFDSVRGVPAHYVDAEKPGLPGDVFTPWEMDVPAVLKTLVAEGAISGPVPAVNRRPIAQRHLANWFAHHLGNAARKRAPLAAVAAVLARAPAVAVFRLYAGNFLAARDQIAAAARCYRVASLIDPADPAPYRHGAALARRHHRPWETPAGRARLIAGEGDGGPGR